MKKTVTWLLALLLALSIALVMVPVAFADNAVPDSVYTGDFTIQDQAMERFAAAYQAGETQFDIYNADVLYTFALFVSSSAVTDGFAGRTVSLKCNMIFNEGNAANWGTKAPTTMPFWNSINNFSGTFDGEGHTVSGIYLTTSANFQGFFGVLTANATVKNLGILNSYFKTTGDYIGGLAGRINGANVTVSNCYVDAVVEGGHFANGGIVSLASGAGAKIEGCVFKGSVTGASGSSSGGIVGVSALYRDGFDTTVSDCVNLGAISGAAGNSAGAMIGSMAHATIIRCLNFGTVVCPTSSSSATNPNALLGKVRSDGATDLKADLIDCYLFTDLNQNAYIRSTDLATFGAEATITTVEDSTTVKGDDAKTVLTALDFDGSADDKTDWVTREDDYPIPAGVAVILGGVANEADPDPIIPYNNDDTTVTTAPEPTTTAPTPRTEPTTTAPATTAEPSVETSGEAKPKKSGCKSSAGMASIAVITLIGGCAVVVTKKKG